MALERLVLQADGGDRVQREHLARYRYACGHCRGLRVLDCASGSGYGSRMLLDAGATEVVGVDVSEGAVETARATYAADRLRFEVGDAQTLEAHGDASFDVVVSFETIEHVPDDEKYLASVHRVLRPGGRFFVSTPDFRFGPVRQRLTGRMGNPFHLREYTGNAFGTLLSKRFRVDEWYGQVLVAKARLFLPVAVTTKLIAYRLCGERGRNYVQRNYFPDDATLVPMADRQAYIPAYWLACCTKVS